MSRLTSSPVVDATSATGGSEASATNGLLSSTEVVNRCVQSHVCLHINTLSQVRHDAVHAGLEICPPIARQVSKCTDGRSSNNTYVPAESSLVGMGGIGDGIVDGLGRTAAQDSRNRRGGVGGWATQRRRPRIEERWCSPCCRSVGFQHFNADARRCGSANASTKLRVSGGPAQVVAGRSSEATHGIGAARARSCRSGRRAGDRKTRAEDWLEASRKSTVEERGRVWR